MNKDIFPDKIIELLGGKDKFNTYPIILVPYNITNPISIGKIDGCPFFILFISYRGKLCKEIFKQKSLHNKEIWECSSNSFIFSEKEYNIYNPTKNQLNDLKNIENLVMNTNLVSIYNFTNDLGPSYDFLNEEARLYNKIEI